MYIRLFFIAFLFVRCSSYNENFEPSRVSPREISLGKLSDFTLTIPDTNKKKLGRLWPKFSSNEEGDLFIFLDWLQQILFLAEPDGRIVSIIGNKGRGPKEFIRVQGFDLDEKDNVVAFDEPQKLIKIFQSDGSLLNSFRVFEDEKYSFPSRGLEAADGAIFLQVLKPGEYLNPVNSKLFASINFRGKVGKLMGNYDPYFSQDKHHHISHSFYVDREHNVIITNLVTSPRIQVFDLSSKKRLAYFGYESPNFRKLEKEITLGLPRRIIQQRALKQSYGIGIYATEHYILHHFQNLTEEWFETSDNAEKIDFLAVYDRQSHDFIEELSLPYFLGLVTNNKLYLIEDDNPDNYTIGIYELKENS